MAKKTSGKNKFKRLAKLLSVSGFCLVAAMLLSVFNHSTDLVYIVLTGVLITPTVVLIWADRKSSALLSKIAATVFLLLISFSPFLPSRQAAIVVDLILIVGVAVFLIFFLANHKNLGNGVTGLVAFCFTASLFLVFRLLVVCGYYTFTADAFLPFWPIPVAAGLFAAAAITVKWTWKNSKVPARIGYFLLAFFLTAASLWSVIMHLNYALDFSTPQEYTVTVESKDTDRTSSRRSIRTYEFVITVDGKEYDMNVPYSDYIRYEEGDSYPILKYKGAFGEAFYVPKEYFD